MGLLMQLTFHEFRTLFDSHAVSEWAVPHAPYSISGLTEAQSSIDYQRIYDTLFTKMASSMYLQNSQGSKGLVCSCWKELGRANWEPTAPHVRAGDSGPSSRASTTFQHYP